MAMVKVLQERLVKRDDSQRLLERLQDLRAAALSQPGYVTGETLFKGVDPVAVLVIATWISREHWEAWETSEARMSLNDLIMPLLLEEPKTGVYSIALEEG